MQRISFFCFDMMLNPIDRLLCEEILCLNPEKLLTSWIKEMQDIGDKTIKVFLQELQQEDPSIKKAFIYSIDGARIAQTTFVEDAFTSNFHLVINESKYEVIPSDSTITSAVHSAIPKTVSPTPTNRINLQQLEELKKEFYSLSQNKKILDVKAEKVANLTIWAGLGFLVVQWCVLARLTWWDFNWDVMEPVTYFITFGTGVLGYAYFTATKNEYQFTDLRDRIVSKRMFKNYLKAGFDVDRYYDLRYELEKANPDLLEEVEHALEEQHQ